MANLTSLIGGGLKWWDEIYTTTAIDTGNGVIQNPSEFTTSANFTVPVGVTKLTIGICGGGGGGTYSGGGGSGMTYHLLNVIAGETIAVTIGAGGIAGTGGTLASASNGGDSLFGIYVTALGGIASGINNIVDGGVGRNGGGNGGINSSGFARGSSITVSRAMNGVLVTKTIQGGGTIGGGAGGGFDYEGLGGTGSSAGGIGFENGVGYGGGGAGINATVVAGAGSQGICVVWY